MASFFLFSFFSLAMFHFWLDIKNESQKKPISFIVIQLFSRNYDVMGEELSSFAFSL